MCITETELSADDFVMLKGYDVWRKDRVEGRGRGVIVMVEYNVEVKKVEYGQGRRGNKGLQNSLGRHIIPQEVRGTKSS